MHARLSLLLVAVIPFLLGAPCANPRPIQIL
jgi:hypothetical protein